MHGIGSQNAGEILLEWSGAIVRSLAQLRLQEGAPVDPVVTTQLDPSSGKDLFIELAYPETQGPNGERVPPEHWVLTEAWWAQRVRPPDFSRMAEWLGPRGAVGRIITAMFAAQRTGDPRQRPHSEAHRLDRPTTHDGGADTLRTTEVGPALSMLERPIAPSHEAADDPAPGDYEPARLGARKRTSPGASFGAVAGIIEQLGVRAFLQAVATLVLLLYGVLRSIEKLLPIGPLKDGALTRPIDQFVLDWFGDVYVLLGDPAQSESVQERLIDSIWNLEAIGCHPIAIVAHSGGAIVTYLTLSDPVTARLRVDRVVTIGEAANLGWRLTKFGDTGDDSDDPSDIHGGLYRTLKNREHPLVWTDFWASQDPAPVGLIRFPRVDLPEVESVGVWNRLSFREDHGGYWDNDEEFVVPLLRRLAGPGAGQDGGRDDFGTDAQHVLRSRKRRERLTILSLWTQVCRALPTAAVIHAYVIGLMGVAVAGSFAAGLFNMIPGSQLITDPINQLRQDYPNGFPDGVAHIVAEVGVRIIALVLAATAIFTLRAPPERSSTFVRPMFEGFDIGYAVIWRAAILYLVLQAALIFFKVPFDVTAINSLLLVAAVFGLALADVAVGRALVSDNPLSRAVARIGSSLSALRSSASQAVSSAGMAAIGYGARVVLMAAGLALVVLIVVSPFVAMAIYPDVGGIVLGTITIFLAFQLLLAVGKWRWSSWDARERVETCGASIAAARAWRSPSRSRCTRSPRSPCTPRSSGQTRSSWGCRSSSGPWCSWASRS